MELRDAYVPSRRVWLGSEVASLCAAGLLIGLIGSGLTWFDRSALFDLADNSLGSVKIGLGFLAGPVAILLALPLVLPRREQVALTRLYRTRILVAATLWLAGLAILVAKVSGLDGYTVKAGTYVSGGLLVVGLLATLAMWPNRLKLVAVNRRGVVRGARGTGSQLGR
ncbi:MAG: hypothetical protein ACRDPE_01570 [Solirubrobacterales bacterium]